MNTKRTNQLPGYRQIRANYDRDTVVVYQAYRDAIAEPAIKHGKFKPPFSWNRMTWIKPSFLWMMARSNWATKRGQENILSIRILRGGFEQALSQGCLTMFDPEVHKDQDHWATDFESSKVHVQWDPERSLPGKKQQRRSLQVGLGREVIKDFTEKWIVEISCVTQKVHQIRSAYLSGNVRRAKSLLPVEKEYEIVSSVRERLGIA